MLPDTVALIRVATGHLVVKISSNPLNIFCLTRSTLSLYSIVKLYKNFIKFLSELLRPAIIAVNFV